MSFLSSSFSLLRQGVLISIAATLSAVTAGAEVFQSITRTGKSPRSIPAADERHQYVAPKATDSRSPCPGINALANHGYLPRDGRNITGPMFVRAIQQAYNFSVPHSYFITYCSLIQVARLKVNLHELAVHGEIEHDASLVHANANGARLAPVVTDPELSDEIMEEANAAGGFGVTEFARARVRRESAPGTDIDFLHQQIALGEAALILLLFGRTDGKVPTEALHSFLIDARIPDGWVPTKVARFIDTAKIGKSVSDAMSKIKSTRTKSD